MRKINDCDRSLSPSHIIILNIFYDKEIRSYLSTLYKLCSYAINCKRHERYKSQVNYMRRA